MKKSILVVLGIIPLLFSCNNNSKGFVDPFPNDEYDSKKIGFKVTSDETIERSLTTQESDLLARTVENLSYINSTLLHRDEGSIHERDYTRAFAGVFKEGYNAYNMMYDEDFKSFYQPKPPSSDETNYIRKKTVSTVNSTYDYAYGRNVTKDMAYKTITFLAVESTNGKYEETADTGSAKKAISARYDGDKDESNKIVSAKIESADETGDNLLPYLYTKQSVEVPAASDPIPGVNSKGEVVLIKEKREPYGETGEYILSDDRKFRAVKNSLVVTRLVKDNDPEPESSNDEPSKHIGDYYRVSQTRIYSEIAITSDAIEPNVPISFLKNPIVINYKEEFHSFITKNNEESNEPQIKDVEVTE